MALKLTEGAVERLMKGEQVDQPVLQVLGQKKITGSSGGNDRYRLLLSDGVHTHSSAMLATQLNDFIVSGDLDNFAVISLDKYLVNTIPPDRRVIILLNITVITKGADLGQEKIGAPQPYRSSGGAAPEPSKPLTNGHGQAPSFQPSEPPQSKPGGATSGNKPGFYGNQTPNKQFSVQNVPKTPGGTPAKVHPIASLTPYQNRWTIRARVTSKSNIRTWSNSRGEGKLFSMNFVDESGEIRATAFTEQVDKFFDMIELNKVYYVTKCTLKTANKQYSSVNNDYEMTFTSETQVIPCEEETNLPTLSFTFVKINELDKAQVNSMIDVIGVVKSTGDLSTIITRQTNKELKKRELNMVDESGTQVRLTLWGEDAEKFDGNKHPVLAVKACRVSDWGGRSLGAVSSTQLIINPDIPESCQLRGWYDREGNNMNFDEYRSEGGPAGGSSGTNWKTFAQVKSEGLGQGEKADFFSSKATVVFLRKENCMYMACPSAECNKKVIDQGNGSYRCEKCSREYPNYKWRMILSANLADHTENQWATCFQDTAEMILGKSADEIGTMREQDEVRFDNLFSDANFRSYIFKFRAKMETYNDESRLKTVCVQATPVDWKDYNQKLISEIDTLLAA